MFDGAKTGEVYAQHKAVKEESCDMDGEEEIEQVCAGVPGGKSDQGGDYEEHYAFGGQAKQDGLSIARAGPAAGWLGSGVCGYGVGLGRERLFLASAGKRSA